MADWAVTQGGGEVAFYGVPELSFSPIVRTGFERELALVCSSCKARYVDIPIGEIGKSAPSRVVSDLQAHPEHEGRGLRHGRSRHGPARRAEGRAAAR